MPGATGLLPHHAHHAHHAHCIAITLEYDRSVSGCAVARLAIPGPTPHSTLDHGREVDVCVAHVLM